MPLKTPAAVNEDLNSGDEAAVSSPSYDYDFSKQTREAILRLNVGAENRGKFASSRGSVSGVKPTHHLRIGEQ